MSDDYNYIRVETDDTLATILLDRIDKQNALNIEMIGEIAEAIKNLENNDNLRLIVFRSVQSEKPVFSAGIDLLDLANHIQRTTPEEMPDLITRLQHYYQAIRDCKLPTVAVIDGLCLGAGLELAIACDFRVATSVSVFGMIETRFGIVPDLGGITYLTRIVGSQVAKRLVLLADQIDAGTALEWGLIDWLVDDPDNKLSEIQKNLLSTSAQATIHAKQLINSTLDIDELSSFENDADAQLELFLSGEPLERTQKFMSSRKPS